MHDIIGGSKAVLYLRELESRIRETIQIPQSLQQNTYFTKGDREGWFMLTFCSNRSTAEAELSSQVWLTFYFNLIGALEEDKKDKITFSVDVHNCPKDIIGSINYLHYTDVTDTLNYWLMEYELYLVNSIEQSKIVSHDGVSMTIVQTGQFLFLNDVLLEKVDLSLVLEKEVRGIYGVYFYDELNKTVALDLIYRFTNRKSAVRMFKMLKGFANPYYTKELDISNSLSENPNNVNLERLRR